MSASHRRPIPEPPIGAIIRVCSHAVKLNDPVPARIGEPCHVMQRIGPNTFHLRRELASGAVNWVEHVTSWVNAPQAQEVRS